MRTIILITILLLAFSLSGKHRIFVSDPLKKRTDKEAILILPGFGSRIHGTKSIADFFFKKDYDVFIPDYIARGSIQKSVDNLNDFINKNNLKEYKKIHVFSYIVGSWVLNYWIQQNPENNIYSVVYDRSPLQERAPFALVKDMPLLIRLASGKIMEEFSKTPYPAMTDSKIRVGILIESKATKLVKKHKRSVLIQGEVSWSINSLKQEYKDYLYTWLNHDDMYTRFDIIGGEIFNFFKFGNFTSSAKRDAYTEDPFIPYIEKK